MKSARKFAVTVLLAVPVLAASVARTQEESFAREQNFRGYVTRLRSDVKAERKSERDVARVSLAAAGVVAGPQMGPHYRIHYRKADG